MNKLLRIPILLAKLCKNTATIIASTNFAWKQLRRNHEEANKSALYHDAADD